MLDRIIWWTGASVLSAGAACAVAFVLGEAVYWTSRILWSAALRVGRTVADLRNMHTWVRAGKPTWYFEEGKMTQMKPTDPAYLPRRRAG